MNYFNTRGMKAIKEWEKIDQELFNRRERREGKDAR
jgi:hypothetical protein